MVKFVIVDDEEKDIKHISKLIDEVRPDNKKILSFTKVDANLKNEINNLDEHKIYILDIQLANNVSGINLAKLIRDTDYESQIIFLTNHDKMLERAFRSIYQVFGFIEKFHDFDRNFKNAIKTIIGQNFDTKMFRYNANNASLSIYYKEILYIYRDTSERKLIIKTKGNEYKVTMTFKEMLNSLDNRFVQCYRSCIVNKDRVRKIDYKEGYFELDTGDKIYMVSEKMCRDKILL